MNKKILVPIAITLVLGLGIGSSITPFNKVFQKQTDFKVNYDVETTTYDGNHNILTYEKTHNTFVDAGKNWTRDCIGQGICGATAFKYIAVGNTTAPTSSSTSLAGEIADCGLARASGTYATIGTGNWSITYLWTSSCNNEAVNTTALFNASSTGTMFMGDSFTTVTLQNTHQLNITITQWVA